MRKSSTIFPEQCIFPMPLFRYFFLLLLSNITLLYAQPFTNGFSFILPHNDTTASQFLPLFPLAQINSADTIYIDANGHFARAGEQYRFWGTNIVADAAFADHAKAGFIAGRMRKLGFNLVRFHHLDNPWSSQNIFNSGSTRQLNPVTLNKLEHLIAELKRNGIYIDMNLNVGRTFTSTDGVPGADSLVDFAKGVTQFDPWLITLQKEYAKQLLTHINPYTGTSLAQDPALAIVEIANENSLYRMWRSGALVPFSVGGQLTVRHSRMLDTLWNVFLSEKYHTTDSLREAWREGAMVDTNVNQIRNGGLENGAITNGWILETHSPASAVAVIDYTNPYHGTASARVQVTATDGIGWHIQWKQTGIRVIEDSTYTITFSARSDSSRAMQVSVMKDTDPYTGYGYANFTLTTNWQTFSFRITAPETCLTETRLSFTVGGQAGTYWFDEIRMNPAVVSGIAEGESLETASVRRTLFTDSPNYTDQRVRDMSSFYITTMQKYFQTMVSWVKDTLGVRAPIASTSLNVGPGDLLAQSNADIVDNHAYWQHPVFPGQAWSETDWYIDNTPMVSNADGGTIGGLFAGIPTAGKPFIVSEYDQPFPNRYQCEAPIFLSAYGAFHNTDAVMFYEYHQASSTDWESDVVRGFFDNHRNSVMMGLMPSLAFAFRNGLIRSSIAPVEVAYAPDDYLLQPKHDRGIGWEGINPVPGTLALTHQVRINSFSSGIPFSTSSLPPAGGSPYITDTREIRWSVDSVVFVQTPNFAAVAGHLDRAPTDTSATLNIISGDGFGAVTWLSSSTSSLVLAESSVVTLVSRVQNSGMMWDGITTVHNSWGSAPTAIEPRTVTVRVKKYSPYLRVVPLDNYGNASNEGRLIAPIFPNVFEITFNQTTEQTIWFGIVSVDSVSSVQSVISAGWNLLSLPLQPPDNRASEIFPGASSSVFTFSNGYVSIETLHVGKGYWVKYPSSIVIQHQGDVVQADTVTVSAGWNIIGGISTVVDVSSVTSIPEGIRQSNFYGYQNGYSISDIIYPARGYWVKVSAPGALVFQSAIGKK